MMTVTMTMITVLPILSQVFLRRNTEELVKAAHTWISFNFDVIFQNDLMVMIFFSEHHCFQWFVNGYAPTGPSSVWGQATIDFNGFQWLSAILVQQYGYGYK